MTKNTKITIVYEDGTFESHLQSKEVKEVVIFPGGKTIKAEKVKTPEPHWMMFIDRGISPGCFYQCFVNDGCATLQGTGTKTPEKVLQAVYNWYLDTDWHSKNEWVKKCTETKKQNISCLGFRHRPKEVIFGIREIYKEEFPELGFPTHFKRIIGTFYKGKVIRYTNLSAYDNEHYAMMQLIEWTLSNLGSFEPKLTFGSLKLEECK